MTTKEFKSYLEGYTDSLDVAIRYKLVSLIHPCPYKIKDMDDNTYIIYMRGVLAGLIKSFTNKIDDPILLPHINHLYEIAYNVETQIFIKIDSKNKYWDKYKTDPPPPPQYWYDKDTIPLNKINKPSPIDIQCENK